MGIAGLRALKMHEQVKGTDTEYCDLAAACQLALQKENISSLA